ncbi:MAG: hypothetical protein A3H44_12640 [Gammaproteobacteria bacterium RIFCSPLOWO2_02_FULL_57_10]|nr:MAG: hypothetical protein A3H44_12640 [Gammaproteobacteria bacterium RIFCSPLOWO2_02_FULL_57_10]
MERAHVIRQLLRGVPFRINTHHDNTRVTAVSVCGKRLIELIQLGQSERTNVRAGRETEEDQCPSTQQVILRELSPSVILQAERLQRHRLLVDKRAELSQLLCTQSLGTSSGNPVIGEAKHKHHKDEAG